MSERKLIGLAHIGIYVSDIEKSIAFYEDLGFVTKAKVPMGEGCLAFLDAGSCELELILRPQDAGRSAGPIDHIAIEVSGIDEHFTYVKEKGVTLLNDKVSTMDALFGGIKNFFFAGPDGERLEYFEYLNK